MLMQIPYEAQQAECVLRVGLFLTIHFLNKLRGQLWRKPSTL